MIATFAEARSRFARAPIHACEEALSEGALDVLAWEATQPTVPDLRQRRAYCCPGCGDLPASKQPAVCPGCLAKLERGGR